jgi:hypothetical protein
MTSRAFYGGTGSGAGGGGFAGAWDSGTAYTEGQTATYNGGLYAATADNSNTAPVTATNLLSGTPADLTVADGNDYELGRRFTVSQTVRLTHLCFHKSSLQTNAPHTLKLWDLGVSTTAPIATTTSSSELSATTGVVAAPLAVDLLTGRTYAVTVTTGAGSDTGYVRTTGVTASVTVGSVTSDAPFFATAGSLASITTGTTEFWVWPRWEEPGANWTLLGRADTVNPTGTTFPAGAPVPYAQLPVGATATTVAQGNHSHIGPNVLTSGEGTTLRENATTGAAVAATTGIMRLAYFTALKSETTTAVRVGTGTTAAAATPTLCRIGLYSIAANGDGTLVASIANDTTLFAGASTSYTRSWSTPYAKVAGQRYAVGLLVVSGATTPTLNGVALSSSAEAAVAPRLAGLISGQTDLPSSFVAGDVAVYGGLLYAAILP